jgi:hypothetical protein
MAKDQRTQFAGQIAAAWRSSLEGIFEAGRLLVAAKEGPEKLPHGEFTKMIEHDLPFGERTAQRLMAIARDRRLTNPTHASLLPNSWMTLYELSLLSDADFEAGVMHGLVKPDMARDDVLEIAEYAEADAAEDDSTDRFERSSATHTVMAKGAVAFPGGPRRSRAPSLAAPAGEPITADDLHRIAAVYEESANRIGNALLALAAESRCDTGEVVRRILDTANSDTLDEMRRGIEFAARLKIALENDPQGGGPRLELIEN